MGDIGAFTVGKICGRTKLAPRLSPGKTIEGAIGGLVFACFGSWVALAVIAPLIAPLPSGWVPPGRGWLIYGVAVGATGMVGDLAESLIKRDMGTKDSSLWLPGFGGVLDLLDSVLLAAPVAYLFWSLRLVGP
jgi:phosphatidate cytidylyltransferase